MTSRGLLLGAQEIAVIRYTDLRRIRRFVTEKHKRIRVQPFGSVSSVYRRDGSRRGPSNPYFPDSISARML